MYQEKITEYQQAREYMQMLTGKGIVLGLASMKRLTERMGRPQDMVKFVHIAGTNGKGSVLGFVSTILHRAGYRVGRYSSPAVFSELEKLQVNGRPISRSDYARGMEQVRLAAEQMEAEGYPYPTAFEAETALAFWYFREKKCELAVLETGMGGTLDATNIVTTTVAAVLTPVSMDHMGMLGDTLSQIASQKAGIIKEGCCVVTGAQKPEAMQVIETACREKAASLYIADIGEAKKIKYGIEKQYFDYREYKKLMISLAGSYQIENAVIAVETIRVLGRCGFPVRESMLRKGLLETTWRGRFTVLARKPYFIIDGAHNEAAAKRLAETVTFHFTNKRIITIMGILKDKEYEKIVRLTAPLAEQIITVTTPGNPRAFPAYELAGVVSRYHSHVTAADSLQEAVEMSYLLADADSVILAFGSLSYLGELSKIVENRDKIRRDAHGRSEKN